MGKKILLLLVVTLIGAVRCQFGSSFAPSYTRSPVADSVNIASMKLLKETYNSASDKNVVASPLGVLTLLSIYAAGAEGPVRDEIMTYLGSSDYMQLERNYTQLAQRLSSMDHSFLSLANGLFLSDKLQLQDDFMYTALAYYSDVGKLNFEDTNAAADFMNQWSAQNTEGKISEPVSSDDIDPAAALVLLNVIYFQGHWHVPFNASETKEQQFHVDRSSSVQKPMMHLEESLYYRESPELGARMVELPYKEHNFRMVVVLPNEVDGLPGVLEKAAEKGFMADIVQLSPSGTEVILDMPKFEIKSKLDLNELLPKVGVSSIFSELANGIVNGTGVVVSRALQEVFISVDEEGATAGAFTGFIAIPISADSRPPPPITFKVDHPFLFAILHEDIVLFTGTYTH